MKVKLKFYDFRNDPVIEENGKIYEVEVHDLYNDCGDCVHVISPNTQEEWRFYYIKEGSKRILDKTGVTSVSTLYPKKK